MPFYFYLFPLVLLLQFQVVINVENSCGCGTNRYQDPALSKNGDNDDENSDKFCSLNSKDQCSGDDALLTHTHDLVSEDHMVLVPTGKYQVGTDDIAIESDNEGPKKIVDVASFYLDKFEVSNRDFMTFVSESAYKTEAEVFGDSFVFKLFLNQTFRDELVDFRVLQALWWYKVSGANWRHPYGPDSDLKGMWDHPVIHVSWNDARAYCSWRGGRLPTEAEWEAACRGGQRDTKYPWGDKLFPDQTHMANIWQGTFPNHNSRKDGYIGTNPVDQFLQNEFGLHNMAGNVWEWVEDSWADDAPTEKVKKGGSYLCHRSYCYRYRCSARSHNSGDSSAGNLGFRCAKSLALT